MLKGLLSIFLQDRCSLCDRPAESELCIDCQRQLSACRLAQPTQRWQGELPLLAWGNYDGKLKQAISALKYDRKPQLGIYFGHLLAQLWQKQQLTATGRQSPRVVPIPLHADRHQLRGFNQAALIAQGFCEITGYPLQIKGIKRVRNTTALFPLSPRDRQRELAQAFMLDSLLQQPSDLPPILLIDDIYTTGSTAREVAQLLTSHRIPLLGIAAIAAAPFRS